MLERFTERARQVVVLAGEEARKLEHKSIGTEHILLGILAEKEGLAARVLDNLGITHRKVSNRIIRYRVKEGKDDKSPMGQIPFTPRGKKILELSLREALSLGCNYVSTEHLLLGLTRDEGFAVDILKELSVSPEQIRDEVLKELSGSKGKIKKEKVPPLPPKESDSFKKVGLKIVERLADTLDELTELVEKKK